MKTAVITGGNSGIGKAVAIELAKRSYRVIIHGRNSAKTQEAAEDIKKSSGSQQVEYVVEDIAGIRGMKALADAIRQKTDTIHALVLSTGVILPKQVLTEDGLEMGFAVQYLSRFAMVQLLMDELKRGHAHIVNVGAPKMKNAQIFFDDIALKDNFSMLKALGQEMYAIHLFTQEFAKRHSGNEMVMNIGHVGIAKTGIMRETNFMMRVMVDVFGSSPQKAASNFVYMATEADFSGYFLSKPGKPQSREKLNYDPATAEKLWNLSLKLMEGKQSATAG